MTCYQFQVDGRPAGPLRLKWAHAAEDAVKAGYGTWKRRWQSVALSDNAGAEIARVEIGIEK